MPIGVNIFPISQYAYATSQNITDAIEWHQSELAPMRVSLTRPRNRLVLRVTRGKDTLDIIAISDLLLTPSTSKGARFGPTQRAVDVQYGNLQLAVSYAGDSNQVKRVRLRLTDSDHLERAAQLLRDAGCPVRNPFAKQTKQPQQRPALAATNARPASGAETPQIQRPCTASDLKERQQYKEALATASTAEGYMEPKLLKFRPGSTASALPQHGDSSARYESYDRQPPAYMDRRPSSHVEMRPPTRGTWSSQQSLHTNSVTHDAKFPSSRDELDDAPTQNETTLPGFHSSARGSRLDDEGYYYSLGGQRSSTSARCDLESPFLGPPSSSNELPTSRPMPAQFSGIHFPDHRVHDDRPMSEGARHRSTRPVTAPTDGAKQQTHGHTFGVPSSTLNTQPSQNIDDLVPPRALPFVSPKKLSMDGERFQRQTQSRPDSGRASAMDLSPLPRPRYSSVTSAARLPNPSSEIAFASTSPPKLSSASNLTIHEDVHNNERPQKKARYEPARSSEAGGRRVGLGSSATETQLRPMSAHEVNIRSSSNQNGDEMRNKSAHPAPGHKEDALGLSEYASIPIRERQRDLDQVMLSLIDSDDFVAMCQDIEVSSARLVLGD